jgi:hypothetical protein
LLAELGIGEEEYRRLLAAGVVSEGAVEASTDE